MKGHICYIRVKVVGVWKEAPGGPEVMVVCIDRQGQPMSDSRGHERTHFVMPEQLIPASVIANGRRAS